MQCQPDLMKVRNKLIGRRRQGRQCWNLNWILLLKTQNKKARTQRIHRSSYYSSSHSRNSFHVDSDSFSVHNAQSIGHSQNSFHVDNDSFSGHSTSSSLLSLPFLLPLCWFYQSPTPITSIRHRCLSFALDPLTHRTVP